MDRPVLDPWLASFSLPSKCQEGIVACLYAAFRILEY